MTYVEQLGVRIVKARRHRGLSQSDVAAILQRSQATISQWETGRRPLVAVDLAKLAYALDVPVDSLLPILPVDIQREILDLRSALERLRSTGHPQDCG